MGLRGYAGPSPGSDISGAHFGGILYCPRKVKSGGKGFIVVVVVAAAVVFTVVVVGYWQAGVRKVND